MTEDELRQLVREAIARQRGQAPAGRLATAPVQHHASHALFVLPDGADADGPCLIEPTVLCHHCGYCKSFGH